MRSLGALYHTAAFRPPRFHLCHPSLSLCVLAQTLDALSLTPRLPALCPPPAQHAGFLFLLIRQCLGGVFSRAGYMPGVSTPSLWWSGPDPRAGGRVRVRAGWVAGPHSYFPTFAPSPLSPLVVGEEGSGGSCHLCPALCVSGPATMCLRPGAAPLGTPPPASPDSPPRRQPCRPSWCTRVLNLNLNTHTHKRPQSGQ